MTLIDLIPLNFGFIWAAAIPWIASAIGAGASLYGANKQSKDQAGTDNANRAAVAEEDRNAWTKYLMQRGMYQPDAATGVIPGAQPGSVQNVKLPLWMTAQPSTPKATGPVVRRRAGR